MSSGHALDDVSGGNPLKVLIVHDSEADTQSIVRRLRRAGGAFEWKRVDDSAGLACALAEETWDIVLSGYPTVAFGGADPLELIRTHDEDMPVILISAAAVDEAALQSLFPGVSDALSMADLKQLDPCIRRAIRHAGERRAARQAEADLRRTMAEVALKKNIADALLLHPGDEAYADVLNLILEHMGSPLGYFGYINDDGDFVCPSLTGHAWDRCKVPDKTIVFPRQAWGGLWGRSLREKRTLCSNESLRPPQGHVPLERCLAVPILLGDVLLGQIALANKSTDYDTHDERLLESIAAYMAPLISNRRIRERAEQEAGRMALEWQRTFNATNSTIWILDSGNKILRANQISEKYFQRSAGELVGKHCWQVVHGTGSPIPECPILRARASLRRETIEMQMDGSWFEITVDPIVDADGRYDGAVHIISDITERKRLHEQLLLAQKMEAVGQLAGGVAHDFNNLLQGIIGYNQMILDRLPEEPVA